MSIFVGYFTELLGLYFIILYMQRYDLCLLHNQYICNYLYLHSTTDQHESLHNKNSCECSDSWLLVQQRRNTILESVIFSQRCHTSQQKHLGYFNHILGCLSCISVTNKCYQIESSLRSLSLGTLASIFFQKTYSTKFLAFLPQPRNQGTLQGQICKIKVTTNFTRNADLWAFCKEILI